MVYKATLFISKDGSFPFDTINVDCLYIEETFKTEDKKNASQATLYIDNKKDTFRKINANNHNLFVIGENHTQINNSIDLKNLVNENQTYLVRKVRYFYGGLPHVMIEGS